MASYGEIRASRKAFRWELPELNGSFSDSDRSTPRHTLDGPSTSTVRSIRAPRKVSSSAASSLISLSKNPISPIEESNIPAEAGDILDDTVHSPNMTTNGVTSGDFTRGTPGTKLSEGFGRGQSISPRNSNSPRDQPTPNAIVEPFMVSRMPSDGVPFLLSLVSADETAAASSLASLLVNATYSDIKCELAEMAITGQILRRLAVPHHSSISVDEKELAVQFWSMVRFTSISTSSPTSGTQSTDYLGSSLASASVSAGIGSRTFVAYLFDSTEEIKRFLNVISTGSKYSQNYSQGENLSVFSK